MGPNAVAAELQRHHEDHVEVITLNRPDQRNALSPALLTQLSQALAEVKRDPNVRSVVLTAAGDRAFCAGMDLKAFADEDGALTRDATSTADFDEFMRGKHPKPVVAAVNGAAVGGGFELLLGCDVVVAAQHARFGLPEVKRGLFAAGGGVTLPARIPLAIALEMGLTGDLIDATRAQHLGLVNRVTPPEETLSTAIDLARVIAGNAPLAVAATKAIMRATIWESPAVVSDLIEHYRGPIFTSADAREGALAFTQRRPPTWTSH
jgi:enoyl-CoA hydratase